MVSVNMASVTTTNIANLSGVAARNKKRGPRNRKVNKIAHIGVGSSSAAEGRRAITGAVP
jgi:hypothetical protein